MEIDTFPCGIDLEVPGRLAIHGIAIESIEGFPSNADRLHLSIINHGGFLKNVSPAASELVTKQRFVVGG